MVVLRGGGGRRAFSSWRGPGRKGLFLSKILAYFSGERRRRSSAESALDSADDRRHSAPIHRRGWDVLPAVFVLRLVVSPSHCVVGRFLSRKLYLPRTVLWEENHSFEESYVYAQESAGCGNNRVDRLSYGKRSIYDRTIEQEQ